MPGIASSSLLDRKAGVSAIAADNGPQLLIGQVLREPSAEPICGPIQREEIFQ
jgi:hypothetical protein